MLDHLPKFSKIPDRVYLFAASFLIVPGIIIFSCERLDLIKQVRIKTVSISDTARTSCIAHGTIIDLGEEGLSEHGYCWSTTNKPTISNIKTELGERNQVGDFTDTLKGLSANTKYYIKAYAIDDEGKPSYGSEISFTTLPPIRATLTTSIVTKVGSDSSVCGGNITSDGDAPVTTRGVCWNTIQNPTLTESINHTNDGSGTGSFESIIRGLNSNTNYYVCAYATNSAGTAYGDDRTFKTGPGIPSLTTIEASSITDSSASSGGNITNDGGASITARGICWSTVHNPSILDPHSNDTPGTGSYLSYLIDLTPATTYYVRSYATNTYGTAYGNEINFKTSAVVPSLTTSAIQFVTSTSAVSGGNITNDGGSPVTARGVCWSINHNPTISNSFIEEGSGTGNFVSNITGLTANTTYYVRAYAINIAGTAYGNEFSFKTNPGLATLTTTEITSVTGTTAISGGTIMNDGGSSVTVRGVCWSTSNNPTLMNSFTTDSTGIGLYISSLTGLSPNTTYYVRAYATNNIGTGYGNELSFKTAITVPILATTAISSVTATTAMSGGNITNSGGASVTARGVCWSTEHNPTLEDCINHTSDGTGTGSFESIISGLNSNTTFYIRAYATNSKGTAYGNEVNFKTNPGLPTVVTVEATSITETSATSGGNVTNDGGAPVTARGVCWGTKTNPTLSDHFITDGSGLGVFQSNLTGLTNKTTYYVRAYATNSSGTAYGNEITFITSSIPVVITFTVSKVTSNSAESGGNVTDNGGTPVIAKGVCWSTSQDPVITDFHTIDGSGMGSFTSIITDLEPNTTYYLRAYATNSAGTAYGAQKSFITSITISDIDGNIYNTIQIGTQLWMSENLKVIHYNDGSPMPLVTDNGAWSNLSTGAYCNINNDENYVLLYGRMYNYIAVINNLKLCPNGWHIPSAAEWNILMNYLGGSNVAGGKMKEEGYDHWSSPNSGATNESGFTGLPGGWRDAAGNFRDFGNLGGWWSISENCQWDCYGLCLDLYYDQARGIIENFIKTDGASVRCLQGEYPQDIPILSTTEITSIKAYSAISGGNITSDGNSQILSRGVCWNTTGSPTLLDNYTTDGLGTGIFTSNLTGLTPLTTYYVRAYATNSMGITYGNEIGFITASDALPDIPTNIIVTIVAPGDEELHLQWDAALNATSYTIYWSTNPDVSKTNFTGMISDIQGTSYIHSGLTNGTKYYYVLTAKNDYGESDESYIVAGAPPFLLQNNHMSTSGEKHNYSVTVSEGQTLIIDLNIIDDRNSFFLYVKFGSLPTTDDYDFISNTGEDETINITSTQAGTYYIMVYDSYHWCNSYYPYDCSAGDYYIIAGTSVEILTLGIQYANRIIHPQQKDYYEVTVSSGQSLFITTHNIDTRNDFYLYAKYGSLPTTAVYDAKSETGEDEAVSIINTQAGTYYIMVFAYSRWCNSYYPYDCSAGDYTINAFTSK